jgi:hypothetical protein
MTYSDDPELKGDVKVTSRGASSLIVKEAAAQRRNELLQMALSSPVAQQIMGLEGTAHLLREQVKTLDLNGDKVVPPPEVVKARAMVAQAQQMAMMQQQAAEPEEQVDIHRDENGQMTKMSVRKKPQPGPAAQPQQQQRGPVTNPNQQLMDGTPTMDAFNTPRMMQ